MESGEWGLLLEANWLAVGERDRCCLVFGGRSCWKESDRVTRDWVSKPSFDSEPDERCIEGARLLDFVFVFFLSGFGEGVWNAGNW